MTTTSEVIWDLEADNLLDNVTKIHCLSYRYVETPEEVTTLVDYKDIADWFDDCEGNGHIAIGHNIIGYDLKVVKKILGVDYTGKKVDTLPLSWYLNHDRVLHGLDSYGEDFGVKKPMIEDWVGLSQEELRIIEYYEDR